MKTATIDVETRTLDLRVEVDFFYYPPENPGGYGRHRVPADIEIKRVRVLRSGSWLRSELKNAENLDLVASNLISDNWEKYKELLIAEARL